MSEELDAVKDLYPTGAVERTSEQSKYSIPTLAQVHRGGKEEDLQSGIACIDP